MPPNPLMGAGGFFICRNETHIFDLIFHITLNEQKMYNFVFIETQVVEHS